MERNEALLFICQMVWAKLVLKKVVNWHTIKHVKNTTISKIQDIPRAVFISLDGGLNPLREKFGNKEENDDLEESKEDNDFDRSCLRKVCMVPSPSRTNKGCKHT